jgi:pimeloyl-ACP methyl ester carboxylesterase
MKDCCPRERNVLMYWHRELHIILYVCAFLSISVVSCSEATRTPEPTATKRPAPTLAARFALQDMRFEIRYDGELVATEELSTQQLEQGLLVTSVIRRVGFTNTLEKRAILLSSTLDPISYDLEIGTDRAHSSWVAIREGDRLSVLNNNLAWYGPVLVDSLNPVAQLMLEGTPSALPFAIQALRLTNISDTTTSGDIQYYYLDVLGELPASLPITFTHSGALKGLVIGTTAFSVFKGDGPYCTLWLRPADRSLYSVEFENFRFNHWLIRTDPKLASIKQVTITRVASLPPLPQAQTPDSLRRIPLEFTGSDGGLRKGILILPDGQGPFPCLVLQSDGGLTPIWDPGIAAAQNGWAVFSYDKRGLGTSDGVFERGDLMNKAADAISAAAMLRQRSELLSSRLVLLGTGEGSVVAALASSHQSGYDGYILAGGSFERPIPDAASTEIGGALTRLNNWDESQALSYTISSVVRWQDLLYKGEKEIVLAGRRANLAPLEELSIIQPATSLAQSTVPTLIVGGENDEWISITQTQEFVSQLVVAGKTNIELAIVSLWDGSTDVTHASLLSQAADEIIWAWLKKLFQ